jgi:hypothetical protein
MKPSRDTFIRYTIFPIVRTVAVGTEGVRCSLITERGLMSTEEPKRPPTTAQSLETWRAAERAVAVTKRGRKSAEAAAIAAEEAAKLAVDTAAAARAALASMTIAEASASGTAEAAKLVIAATREDVVDAKSDAATATDEEAAAREEYLKSAARAAAAK